MDFPSQSVRGLTPPTINPLTGHFAVFSADWDRRKPSKFSGPKIDCLLIDAARRPSDYSVTRKGQQACCSTGPTRMPRPLLQGPTRLLPAIDLPRRPPGWSTTADTPTTAGGGSPIAMSAPQKAPSKRPTLAARLRRRRERRCATAALRAHLQHDRQPEQHPRRRRERGGRESRACPIRPAAGDDVGRAEQARGFE